jgi:hypothetical protein
LCFANGLKLTDKSKHAFVIVPSVIQHIIVFPKPEDCKSVTKSSKKNSSSYMMLLVLKETVTYKNKPLKQVCLQLPVQDPTIKDDDCEKTERSNESSSSWIKVLAQALHFDLDQIAQVYKPSDHQQMNKTTSNAFVSHQEENGVSTTVSGMPFVTCYHTVHDGVLYPLECGLLFYKPVLFVPRGHLHSIELVAGSSRYVTLSAVVVNNSEEETTIEFTNISSVEQDGLRKYIHNTLIPAMQRDVNDDGDDEFAMEMDDDDNNSRKRKASVQARAINKRSMVQAANKNDLGNDSEEDEEEDDDGDYHHAGESEEEQSDDDEVDDERSNPASVDDNEDTDENDVSAHEAETESEDDDYDDE